MDLGGFWWIWVDFGGFWWISMVKPDQTEPTRMVDFGGRVVVIARSIFCIFSLPCTMFPQAKDEFRSTAEVAQGGEWPPTPTAEGNVVLKVS